MERQKQSAYREESRRRCIEATLGARRDASLLAHELGITQHEILGWSISEPPQVSLPAAWRHHECDRPERPSARILAVRVKILITWSGLRVPPVAPIGSIASWIASSETACGKLYLPPPPTEETRHIQGETASTSSRLTPRLEA